MSDITLSVQVISDKFQMDKADSSASASETIARVLRNLTMDATGKFDPNEYKVLIAYQLLTPELSLERLLQQEIGATPDGSAGSLEELNIKTGYYIFFVKPIAVTTNLELLIQDRIFNISEPNIFIGKEDEEKNIHPTLDLTPFLGPYENKVSRQLLILKEVEGKWMVRLHPNAHSSVFLDGYKLKQNEQKEIGDTLNIGNSPEAPYLRIKTRVISD